MYWTGYTELYEILIRMNHGFLESNVIDYIPYKVNVMKSLMQCTRSEQCHGSRHYTFLKVSHQRNLLAKPSVLGRRHNGVFLYRKSVEWMVILSCLHESLNTGSSNATRHQRVNTREALWLLPGE